MKENINEKILSNEEILWEAMMKASKNGWIINEKSLTEKDIEVAESANEPLLKEWKFNANCMELLPFNHNFAKAFFGEKWKKHLQDMVLYKNPLEYVKKFL